MIGISNSYIISPQSPEIMDIVEPGSDYTPNSYSTNTLKAIEPNLRDYIPMNQLRRMGRAVRFGTGAAIKLMEKDSRFSNSDAIILTTANGGLEDCIKFLKQMTVYGDGALTPTNFVQSTPNAIAGNIALTSKNQGYNMTHVNNSFAFVDGLRDAFLFLRDRPASKILLGSVDEISDYNFNINTLRNDYKSENIDSLSLIESKTTGTICGEGCSFFGLESAPNDGKTPKIVAFDTLISDDETIILDFVRTFLNQNQLTTDQIDALMLGYNGNVTENATYDAVSDLCSNSNSYTFKDLFGEHPSVISLGAWYGSQLLKGAKVINKPLRIVKKELVHLLLFNKYKDEVSIILLKI